MKLVETDLARREDEVAAEETPPTPPRPEHRRVAVSLLLTLPVLVATVVLVYAAFPERHNQLLTQALEAHRSGRTLVLALDHPSRHELRAWSLGLLGARAPWPAAGHGAEVVDAASMTILRRPAGLVNYRIDGDPVSVIIQRARDAPPRRFRRRDHGDVVVSWRHGPWTMVAVGPRASASRWERVVGAP